MTASGVCSRTLHRPAAHHDRPALGEYVSTVPYAVWVSHISLISGGHHCPILSGFAYVWKPLVGGHSSVCAGACPSKWALESLFEIGFVPTVAVLVPWPFHALHDGHYCRSMSGLQARRA